MSASLQLDRDHATNPLDILEQIIASNEWAFERRSDGEMAAEAPGKWCDYGLHFSWSHEISAMAFTCAFDLKVPAESRDKLYELLALANDRLWIGHFGIEAEDGVPALELFRTHKVDVVLLDVMMIELDGFAVCSTIRGMPNGEHIPIMMMTGLDDTVSINTAYDAGATDFVTKPINYGVLTHRVRYMLRAARIADELRRSEARLRLVTWPSPSRISARIAVGAV